ncbi:sn-glycerol-3-phosphate ABC transporter ATP-binding protein UgpC [Verrucomicrobiaceae bacterium N1E253]|uniref:sn-glycerol-3-phosphate ABC transporter ATP-binding protein UgpC n=1 Tax=Oceaniferula marina TaxID=2748318 RepID=A0A851GG95_9BACT|nr:sn-glycerol-3-phosphate ABC transporter ATP-binding protein UgpC [Oceaniferula marina]NWK56386.1 sn-glycerol-3-phosphate ABC transporter ATP-binding protein UgpC [Oceaniferula marina]
MEDASVSIKSLDKVYLDDKGKPSFHAVKAIDLEIHDGEFMVLVGPSGCGKSTTLRMIAGLESISGGTISIGNAVVNDLSPKDRDIAMVFQNYALYPHMTLYDNMAFGLKLKKFSKAEIDERIQEASEILGLTPMLQRKPKALSGGQRQRVAVGRAIVRHPKVFLFDEPLSNLDAKMRVSTRAEISKLHKKLGSTMVYVTHDQVEAMTMGDRITVMKDGDIMQVDDPLNLYQNPANMFVAGFIGSPPMNLLHGTIESSESGITFVEESGEGEAARITLHGDVAQKAEQRIGQATVFGIRPEHCSEHPSATHSTQISAPVEIAEIMGEETYVHLQLSKHLLIARVNTESYRETTQQLNIHLNLDKAKLFDPATEQVL